MITLRCDATVVGLALLLVGCTDIKRPEGVLGSSLAEDSQGAGSARYAWTGNRQIPDGDRRGILIGPIPTNDDGAEIGRLAMRLDIRHPAVGDLDVWLAYDADGDGDPETRAPVEFHRSRPDISAEEMHACPISLEGACFFRDGWADDDAPFACFARLPRGHRFYLSVADTLAGDTGRVMGWVISLEGAQLTQLH